MRTLFLFAAFPIVHAVRIIQSNDDGWADSYIRTLFNALVNAGYQVILSAPAINRSGTGMYQSCPAFSPPTGANASDPRLNYVNSFPVTAMQVGIDTTAPKLWGGGKPELAITGINIGPNLAFSVPTSGTIGAAVYAAKTAHIPAIAFAGRDRKRVRWDQPPPVEAQIYAAAALNVTNAIVASGAPYLPPGVWLNVNFPTVFNNRCRDPKSGYSFNYILTRIEAGGVQPPELLDVEWCGTKRLPDELRVLKRRGCFATISVGSANDTSTADTERQALVLERLKPILTCLPRPGGSGTNA